MRDIVRRIMNTDFEVSDMTAWQAEKLQQAGMVFDDILKEVANSTGKTKAEIKAAFDDAKTEVFNYDDEVLEAEHIPPTEFKTLSPKMKRMYKAALAKTCTEAINLTKTTATTSMSAYISACDLAHMQITSGAFTYQTAIKNAVISAAKQGCTVIYPSGHKSSLNAAIRRAVLTGVNQTSGKVQEMRADEYQIDLMEISAHAGARPEHAQWQGKIVSRSGRKGYLSLDDIGYGEVTGFMGANCRHDWHMYFEGASKPAYTQKQLNELKNAEVTYNGETMPMWKGIQKQRAMEYSVRQSKSILVACDEAIKNSTDGGKLWKSEFNAEAVKLKSREAKLRDFCKQTGLNRDRYREQVFATETTSGIKNFGKSTSQKAVWADKKILTKKTENDILKIHQGRQDKHIVGSNNYIEGRSYLTVSNKEINDIVKTKSDVKLRTKGKECIVADRIIGVNINTTHGHKTLTDKANIHHSKKGSHIVPKAEQLRKMSIDELKVYCKKVAVEYYDTADYLKYSNNGSKLTINEKIYRINLLLQNKNSKNSLIKDIKSMEKKILKSRGDIQ